MSDFVEIKNAKFSPLMVTKAVLDTLRYFFRTFSIPELRWSPDEKETMIVIDTFNNIIGQDEIQKKPRILIRRDPYVMNKTSLSGDLVEAAPMDIMKGKRHTKHMNLIDGSVTIAIEAYNEGTAELLADAVSHFIAWSSDHICNQFRFKKFGYPMSVSEVSMDRENREKFKIVLSMSYTTETCWVLDEDALKLRGLFIDLQQG